MQQTTITALSQLNEKRDEFYNALLIKHVNTIEALLHENFIFTQPNGLLQKRQAFTYEFILDHTRVFKAIEKSEEEMVIIDNTALITTHIKLDLISSGKPMTFHERFTEVYIQQDGCWKLLTIHATLLSAA